MRAVEEEMPSSEAIASYELPTARIARTSDSRRESPEDRKAFASCSHICGADDSSFSEAVDDADSDGTFASSMRTISAMIPKAVMIPSMGEISAACVDMATVVDGKR